MCLAMFVCAGCASTAGGDTANARVFDACSPLALDVSTVSAGELANVTAAIASWTAVGVTAPVVAGGDAPGVLAIAFEPSSPAFYGYYDGDTIFVSDDLASDAERDVVIAHELGHALGLAHVPATERGSVMNPGNLALAPTAADAAAIAARWGCARGDEHRAP